MRDFKIPAKLIGSTANNFNNNGGKPRVPARVFVMSRVETAAFDDLIHGKCFIQDLLVDVLYNSGATYSFVSHDYVEKLGLCASKLPYDVVVSTPMNKPVITSKICLNYPISVEGRSFVMGLICFPLSQFNIVLGMDWLSSNHDLLDYKDKTLMFRNFDPE